MKLKVAATVAMVTYKQNRLPRHPSDGQQDFARCHAVVRRIQVGTDAEVGNLDGVVLADEAVAGGQVAVDEVQLFEVLHAGRDLRRHVDQTPVTVTSTSINYVNHCTVLSCRYHKIRKYM